MNLDSYSIVVSFSNFIDYESTHLFCNNNLFNYCIDFKDYTLSAISKIDFKEHILIEFGNNLIPSNKHYSYNIETNEIEIRINFEKKYY